MNTKTHHKSMCFRSKSPMRILPAAIALSAGLTNPAIAMVDQHFSWNTGNGLWTNANNWTSNSVPGNAPVGTSHFVHIGDLPGVQNSTVLLDWPGMPPLVIVGGLSLSSGMTLDTNNYQLATNGTVSLMGSNTRLIVSQSSSVVNQSDFFGQLQMGVGTYMELQDDPFVSFIDGSVSSGEITGNGTIRAGWFRNNGVIRPSTNGGITIDQWADELIDLDGGTGNGQLALTTQFSELTVNAIALRDDFSGTISMAPGALLSMNIDNGWTSDASSVLNVAGFNNPAAASQIQGSEMVFGGTMNVGAAQGHLRVLAPTVLQSTAVVNIGNTDWVEFDGATTALGGQYNIGLGGKLDFDGATTIMGGEFNTASNALADGGVFFNGTTQWHGTVNINGAARQNGDAIVAGGLGAVINADKFDMDGADQNTHWDIHAGLVVNANTISGNNGNGFNGSMDISGGFLSKLTMNLSEGAWNNLGETTLSGDPTLYLTRIAGSGMQLFGDLTVRSGRVRIDSDMLVAASSSISFDQGTAALMTTGDTWVQSNAEFIGSGTLRNGSTGEMLFSDGVSLFDVGFRNDGHFNIGIGNGVISSGAATVARFESAASATWALTIGGYQAGDEFDMLTVSGDANLNGNLEVSLANLGEGIFRPHVGDEFEILLAFGTISGSFLNDPISFVGPLTYEWEVLYNSNSVVLRLENIVPAPGSAALVGLGSLIAVSRRRRTGYRGLRS